MQPWRQRTRIPGLHLALALAVVLLGTAAVESGRRAARQPYYDRQIAAALLMSRALSAIREYRVAIGDPIDPVLDPNRTGLIGPELGVLTTSLGNLEAKRTSTNPAFAALLVKYFHEAGLARGDVVAIGASGSFPALILATLSAARAMDLKPVLIYSIGASTYGANTPDLSLAVLLPYLRRLGILPYRLAAVSLGGEEDRGKSAYGAFIDGGRRAMLAVARQSGAPLIAEDDLAQSIRRRLEIYRRAAGVRPIECFVNIGGADPNYGITTASLNFPNGLVLRAAPPSFGPERGLIFEFVAMGVPVVNLLDLRGLALKNGLPVDPVPLPPIGSGDVYYRIRYPRWLILAVLAAGGLIVAAGVRHSRNEKERRTKQAPL